MQTHCSWTIFTKRKPSVECDLDVCDPARVTYEVIPVYDARLQIRAVGYGQPLLLLHGVPGDCETLAPVADLLAVTRRATTVSLRYSGHGPHGARPFGTQQQYEDLMEIVETIGGPIDLAAWSYSAHAALALAIERPDLVRSLYLFEPGFPTFVSEPDDLARIEEDTMSAFGPVFGALSAGDLETALRHAIDGAVGQAGWFDTQPEAIRQIHQRNAGMLPLLLRQTPVLEIDEADLGRIRCPVTVAWGAETRLCYRLVSEAVARIVPGAHASRLTGNHLLPETAPETLSSDIRAHLARAASEVP